MISFFLGGYDDRVEENKSHFLELETLANSHGLSSKITFMRSFSDKEKIALLLKATCLLYTPSDEHFGIVPIEAMFMKCPVIACNSGGPLETVKHTVSCNFFYMLVNESFSAGIEILRNKRTEFRKSAVATEVSIYFWLTTVKLCRLSLYCFSSIY